MRLQLALDFVDLEEALALAAVVSPQMDWLEAGTLLVKSRGMAAVVALRERFPSHTLVADLKTADGGRRETEMAFAAGADVTTVLGLIPDRSVAECLDAAASRGRMVFVDLLGCAPGRWDELRRLGATHVIYHIGKDEQGTRSLQAQVINQLREEMGFTVALAGGLTPERAQALASARPAVLIVGSAVTASPDPAGAAAAFRAVANAATGPR